jgi:ATP-dependent Lon protease
MKILYPDGKTNAEEAKKLISFSMEARRRMREHILQIDDTFKRHDFRLNPLTVVQLSP